MSAVELVTVQDGTPATTSLVIAEGTDNEHRAVLQLIRTYAADLNEVGGVAFQMRPFETAGGMQRREIAVMDEPASALLMTYLKNSEVVRDFKKRLVSDFYAMRQQLTTPAVPQTYAAALRAAADQSDRAELAEAKIAELEPKAQVADKLLDANGDLSVRDAAQALTRAGVKVGATRLFAELDQRGWIKRAGDGRYRVIQSAIETGHMSVLPASHYHPKTGVLVLDPPQPRVTPKGIQRLLADYDKS